MGELGEQLRAAREAKESTLEQAAEETRIPLSYLAALESESFEVFTSDLHAKGFLRNYAAYLGQDADHLIAVYSKMRGLPLSRRDGMPVSGHSPGVTGRSVWALDILLGLVIVSLALLGGFSFLQHQGLEEATPTAVVLPEATVTPVPLARGTAYELNVHLDYPQHRLDVQQRIDYTNVTSQTLSDIVLNVHPNRSRNVFELIDIKVDVDGEMVAPEVFPLDVTLRVALPRELQPNEHTVLYLSFILKLPKISPSEEFSGASFGYSSRAMSVGNWYPVLAPFREDKGWYGLTQFVVGDPYVTEVADYRVTITATEGIVIGGTGRETRSGNRWSYEAEQARSFAFAASDMYEVETIQVGGVNVHGYSFPNHREAAQVALETAARALELFIELYGPYPYADYRLCETEFAGGLEFSGLTFLGSPFYEQYDGSTRTPLIPLTAHEVSHQWFYGLVGNDQVTEPWLDEAFAEYSSFLYYERYLPADTDWWWNYVVDQWAPTGIIDARIHEFRNNRDYLDAVYRRGAQFVRDLRLVMGDPAFFAMLQEYQRRYAYQLVRSRDFFALVQEYTTADLVPLQEEYFRQRIPLNP
jgi:hypothetical protein